jgi:hypothetical protein
MANTYFNIAKQVLATAASTVTFSGIPQTYDDLVVRISAHSTDSNTVDNLVIRWNGDSGSNYVSMAIFGTDVTTQGTSATVNTTYIQDIQIPTNSLNALYYGSTEIYMPRYTTTGEKQSKIFNACDIAANTSGSSRLTEMANYYKGTAAITSITFASANGANLAANSGFWLYGIKNT